MLYQNLHSTDFHKAISAIRFRHVSLCDKCLISITLQNSKVGIYSRINANTKEKLLNE